jgi:hypothetical protein
VGSDGAVGVIETVRVDAAARPSEVDALVEAFRAAGFEVEVERAIEHRAHGELAWLVQVTLGEALKGFFFTMGATAFGVLLKAIKDARRGRGRVEISDPAHTVLWNPHDVPQEGIDALAELDWESMEGSILAWDAERHEWYRAA